MRELKIFAVIVFFTGVLYWGVEPFAHSQMHPHVDAPDYTFKDVDGLNGKVGDAAKGKEQVAMNCTACHSIESEGFPMVMDAATAAASYGVVPPDLSSAGYLYNDDFLAAFIKDPVKATKTAHAFVDGKIHPMPGYAWLGDDAIADIVAYFKSIAPQKMTNKEVFSDACQRCHSIKYGDFRFDGTKSSMAAFTPVENITAYMGKTPPDLSQYIRSRGDQWLHEFINDPQKHLHGTAMPRVGLTKDAETQVVAYMTEVGDSSKPKREALAGPFLGYLVILAIFAWLWKAKIWREVH